MKYDVATPSVFVEVVSDVFNFVSLCLLTSDIDLILYSIDYLLLLILNNSIKIRNVFSLV